MGFICRRWLHRRERFGAECKGKAVFDVAITHRCQNVHTTSLQNQNFKLLCFTHCALCSDYGCLTKACHSSFICSSKYHMGCAKSKRKRPHYGLLDGFAGILTFVISFLTTPTWSTCFSFRLCRFICGQNTNPKTIELFVKKPENTFEKAGLPTCKIAEIGTCTRLYHLTKLPFLQLVHTPFLFPSFPAHTKAAGHRWKTRQRCPGRASMPPR